VVAAIQNRREPATPAAVAVADGLVHACVCSAVRRGVAAASRHARPSCGGLSLCDSPEYEMRIECSVWCIRFCGNIPIANVCPTHRYVLIIACAPCPANDPANGLSNEHRVEQQRRRPLESLFVALLFDFSEVSLASSGRREYAVRVHYLSP
jgi:hypothetical protein